MNTKMSSIDVEKSLSGVTFPAEKQDLINFAKSRSADRAVIGALNSLPNRQYSNTSDVASALNGESEMDSSSDDER